MIEIAFWQAVCFFVIWAIARFCPDDEIEEPKNIDIEVNRKTLENIYKNSDNF